MDEAFKKQAAEWFERGRHDVDYEDEDIKQDLSRAWELIKKILKKAGCTVG